MKRVFYFFVLVFLASGVYAQDAAAIMSEYLTKTNISNHKDQTLRLEMQMNVQENEIPITISYAKNQKDMRIDMSMQNNDMSFVIVGNSGWIETGDQCQDLPAEFVNQTRHASIFSTVSDMSGWTFSYVEKTTDDGREYHKIKGLSGNDAYFIWVNTATGLVDYIDTTEQGAAVRICLSEYKQFGDVTIPSLTSTVGNPQMTAEIRISSVTFNVDLPSWYFERP